MDHTEIAIIGAGVCGVLAGHQCGQQGISYRIVERERRVGGVWGSCANTYSQLQVKHACATCSLPERLADGSPPASTVCLRHLTVSSALESPNLERLAEAVDSTS